MHGIQIVEGKKRHVQCLHSGNNIFTFFVHNFLVLNILDSPISVTTHLFILSYELLDLNVTNNQS